jgi:hypothetical protein
MVLHKNSFDAGALAALAEQFDAVPAAHRTTLTEREARRISGPRHTRMAAGTWALPPALPPRQPKRVSNRDMAHLLIDRFRFDSFVPNLEEGSSRQKESLPILRSKQFRRCRSICRPLSPWPLLNGDAKARLRCQDRSSRAQWDPGSMPKMAA